MENPSLKRLFEMGSLFLLIGTLFLVILIVNAVKENRYIGTGIPPSNVVSVNGEGEVFAVPDIAKFTFSVIEKRATVDEAQDASAEKVNAIIAYLKGEGIDEKDIKTVDYSAYPQYEWHQETIVCVRYPCPQPPGEQILTGYEVNQSVSVKVRDTERAGTLLSGVGERGVSNVSGLVFTVDDEDALEREARALAIADAKEQAQELARDLGVKLVRVVSFYESGPVTPYYGFGGDTVLEAAPRAAVVPDVPVGENRIISNVTITYEIR
jgi:hypothetical protein